jgi:hypothetical protein
MGLPLEPDAEAPPRTIIYPSRSMSEASVLEALRAIPARQTTATSAEAECRVPSGSIRAERVTIEGTYLDDLAI